MSIDTRPDTTTRSSRKPSSGLRTPARSAPQPAPIHTPLIRAGVVQTPGHEELALERVTPSVLRVTLDGRTLGFVEHVGRVYVALAGDRYDRAVEIAQTLDVAAAARSLS
jgi:hypothetical protein